MTLQDDIRGMIDSAATLTGTPTTVTLKSGVDVEAFSGVATINDTLLGTPVAINGDEKTLRFVAADVPGIKAGDPLTWNSKLWKVKHPLSMANGSLTKVFLQEAL
jgi:hypothetical protein